MPVAVRGGRLSQRRGVTLTGLGKDSAALSNRRPRRRNFHQGNRVPIYGIGDVVALEIYSAELSWHYIVFYPFLYCLLTEWVDFLGVLVLSATKFKSGKRFYYYNL